VGGAGANDRIQPLIELPPELPELRLQEAPYVKEMAEQRKTLESSTRWVIHIVLAVLGAFAGWDIWHAARKAPARATGSPKKRVVVLGLGADGKGGVWWRGTYPWEK
jgi:hypothetical protein